MSDELFKSVEKTARQLLDLSELVEMHSKLTLALAERFKEVSDRVVNLEGEVYMMQQTIDGRADYVWRPEDGSTE